MSFYSAILKPPPDQTVFDSWFELDPLFVYVYLAVNCRRFIDFIVFSVIFSLMRLRSAVAQW